MVEESKKRLPKRLWTVVEQSYYNWIYRLPEIDGMRALVEKLKNKGVKLYVLSNISVYFANRYKEIPILQLFDGWVFSGVIQTVKPSRGIFNHLFEKYAIQADESVFIDDAQRNIDGAKAVGLTTYLFDGDAKRLDEYLDEILK